MGVDGHDVAIKLGDGAGRADGAVHLVRTPVDRLQRPGRRRPAGPGLGLDHRVLWSLCLQPRVGIGWQDGAFLPARRGGKGARGLDGGPFPLGDDAQEVAVAHHLQHAGHRLDGGRVHAEQIRPIGRLAHHPAVGQALGPMVLDEDGLARDLCPEIEARRRLADVAASGR